MSAPIQSAYGWHIIKLIDRKGIDMFENMKEDLQSKVKRDERASLGLKSFVAKLKSDYKFTTNNESVKEYYSLLDKKTLTDSIFQLEAAKLAKPIMTIAAKAFIQSDFTQFLKANSYTDKTAAADIIDEKYAAFAEKEIFGL